MNQNQRFSIFVGLAILAAMWLFPPWSDYSTYDSTFGGDRSQYSFLLSSKNEHIDFGRLIAQNVVVVVGWLTIAAFLAFRSSAPKSRNTKGITPEAIDKQRAAIRTLLILSLIAIACISVVLIGRAVVGPKEAKRYWSPPIESPTP